DDRPIHLTSREGIVQVDRPVATSEADARVTVTRLGPERDTLSRHSFRYEPKPLTPERMTQMMEPQLRSWLGRVGEGADSAGAVGAAWDARVLPPLQVPVLRAHLGADGVVWLGREGAEPLYPPTEWALIGVQGEPLGRVEIPMNVEVRWSRSTTVWAS